ncbi:MAG: hypothetical protein SWK76_17580 [Actinomycetota bacterium]|nr:hypothetical protein [Actinomycetota bacterium]
MPVVRDIGLKLRENELLSRQGLGEHAGRRPGMEKKVMELVDEVEGSGLLRPVMAYEIHPINRMEEEVIELEGGTQLRGHLLPASLREAKEIAAVACTIGPGLEEESTACFAQNKALRGMLLDGIGSAAVDALSRQCCLIIMEQASARDYETSGPLSPGMPGFPMREQRSLFELMPADEIGVSLLESGIMSPRKSESLVIGMGPEMVTWTKEELCAHCPLRKTCPYRLKIGK